MALVLDPVVAGEGLQAAIEKLGATLRDAGFVPQVTGDADRTTDDLLVLIGTADGNGPAARALRAAQIEVPSPTPTKTFAIRQLTVREKPALVLCGVDERSLTQATLHVARLMATAAQRPPVSVADLLAALRKTDNIAAAHLATARQRAAQVMPMIVAAVHPYGLAPERAGAREVSSFGVALARYADSQGAEPGRFESFAEAARRILAEGRTSKRPPDATSRWFDAIADAILASVRAAEQAGGDTRSAELDAALTELRITAHLARFHARRIIAAVHYGLFKRGLRLAELVAATYAEKKAVDAWRELVAVAGGRETFAFTTDTGEVIVSGRWRDELRKLEASLRDLEEQCCPPDEAVLKEKVWTPMPGPDEDWR